MRVSIIVAMGRNHVIGDGKAMPWHLPRDLRRFRRLTMGKPILMGRKTFESIGRALPGRRTIVITRQPDWAHADVETAHSLTDALSLAGPADEVFVCGGGQVYVEAMPFARRLLITEVDQEPSGDVVFPVIEPALWRETGREPRDGFSWVAYERA